MIEETDLQELAKETNEFFSGTLSVSKDKQKAFITLTPGEKAAELKLASLQEFIQKKIATAQLHHDVVSDVCEKITKKQTIEKRRIAKGKDAEDGHDGKVVWLVKRLAKKPKPGDSLVTEEARTNFDLRQRNLFENISAKVAIARIYPPTSGSAGVDVLGKSIGAKTGKPVKLQVDTKSVSIQGGEGHQSIVALVDGYATDDDGKIKIEQKLSVQDIDFHTGSVDFIGAVAVSGNVNPGFAVKGTLGVQIDGSSQNAFIESSAGDCVVKGFCFGGEQGKIFSGKGITLSVAQEVTAEAREQIIITKEARGCELRSQGPIVAEQARISGGSALAVCGLQAGILGNEVGEKTIIKLCNSIEMTKEYMELNRQEESHRRAVELVELHLGPYAKAPEKSKTLPALFRLKIEALIKKHVALKASLESIRQSRGEILKNAHENRVLRVNILKKAYPGVVIMHGEDVYRVETLIVGPCSIEWNEDAHEFVKTELKPLECTWRAESEIPPDPVNLTDESSLTSSDESVEAGNEKNSTTSDAHTKEKI